MHEEPDPSLRLIEQADLRRARRTLVDLLPRLQLAGATLKHAGNVEETGRLAKVVQELERIAQNLKAD